MPKVNLGFRVEPETFAKLENMVQQTGRSQTELLTEVLLLYLGEPIAPSLDQRLQELEQRLAVQQSMIDTLYQHFELTWIPDEPEVRASQNK